MKRNAILGTLLMSVVATVQFSGAALAQAYPSKPVRWVIPFPPGGGTDLISRTITHKLAEQWGVQVIADNRPGAVTYGSPGNGTIGHLSLEMLKADARINMLHAP